MPTIVRQAPLGSLTRAAGLPARAVREPFVVGVLPGEGVGPGLVELCLDLLDVVGDRFGRSFEVRIGGAIGLAAVEQGEEPLPDHVRAFCRLVFADSGAVFAGAGGDRFVYDMRRCFELFVKFNPLPRFPELTHGLAGDRDGILVIRENLGGLYQGASTVSGEDGRRRVAHCFDYDEQEVARVTEVGARIAASRRGRLAVVAKDAGLPDLTRLWFECARRSAASHGVSLNTLDIDFAAYALVSSPGQFDVIVAPNCFGDILADLGGVLCGSRGMTYGSSHAANGAAVYQTNHGAAYDLVGTDRANPVGQILAMAMMLRESFQLVREADAIEQAVRRTLHDGWRTDDLAKTAGRGIGTAEFAAHVRRHLLDDPGDAGE